MHLDKMTEGRTPFLAPAAMHQSRMINALKPTCAQAP